MKEYESILKIFKMNPGSILGVSDLIYIANLFDIRLPYYVPVACAYLHDCKKIKMIYRGKYKYITKKL